MTINLTTFDAAIKERYSDDRMEGLMAIVDLTVPRTRASAHEVCFPTIGAQRPVTEPAPGCNMKNTDGERVCNGIVYSDTRSRCPMCGCLSEASVRAVCESVEAFAYDPHLLLRGMCRNEPLWTACSLFVEGVGGEGPTPLLAFQAMRDALRAERLFTQNTDGSLTYNGLREAAFKLTSSGPLTGGSEWISLKGFDKSHNLAPVPTDDLVIVDQARHDEAKPAIKVGDVVRHSSGIFEVSEFRPSPHGECLDVVMDGNGGSVYAGDCVTIDPHHEPLRVGDEVVVSSGRCPSGTVTIPDDCGWVSWIADGERFTSPMRGQLRLVRRRGDG